MGELAYGQKLAAVNHHREHGSACEGLFGRVKNEFLHYRDWCATAVEEFIERLDDHLWHYNDERP